jgi:diguanylate cyclase (GGDEF)-like protein
VSLRTFITRDEEERTWMLDMHARLVPRVGVAFVLCGLALLPWMRPWTIGLLAVMALVAVAADRLVPRSASLEPVVAAWFVAQALIAAIVAFGDAVMSGGLVFLLVSVVGASGGFPDRLVVVGTAYCIVLMVLAGLATAAGEIAGDPRLLLIPVAAALGAALIGTAVRRSSIEHRSAAVVDPLTGMLNRSALDSRAAELEHQSAETLEPVGMAVLDLDGFKAVNDAHGHTTGDQVLAETAARLRGQLRASDVAYRMGGDEFVVLLPGADRAVTLEVAERLCATMRAAPLAGVEITASVGVSSSEPRGPFDFAAAFAQADAALYAAKQAGRDRVHDPRLSVH